MTGASKARRNGRSLAAAPHMVWAVLFIVAPLIFVAVFSFTSADGGFTFRNFADLAEYKEAFIRSASYSLIATVICLLIGYPLAYGISGCSPKVQRILIMMVMLPMWINFLIRTYAIMKILEDTGLINSLLQLVFGEDFELHMINTVPPAVVAPSEKQKEYDPRPVAAEAVSESAAVSGIGGCNRHIEAVASVFFE